MAGRGHRLGDEALLRDHLRFCRCSTPRFAGTDRPQPSPRAQARRHLLGLLLAATLAAVPGLAAAEGLTLGLISTGTPEATKAARQPLADALSRAMNAPVTMVSSKNWLPSAGREERRDPGGLGQQPHGDRTGRGRRWCSPRWCAPMATRATSPSCWRKESPVKTLDDDGQARRFTLHRRQEVDPGYLVPNYFIFAKRKVDPAGTSAPSPRAATARTSTRWPPAGRPGNQQHRGSAALPGRTGRGLGQGGR